jgi:putative endopeptidase
MKNRLLALPVMALFLSPFVNNDEPLAQTPGLDFSNMDTSATPGTDFFQYACGGWMKKNPIPNEYARFGTFDQLAENNRKQLHNLILGLSAKSQPSGSVAYKIATLYNQVMDSVAQNKMGISPLLPDMQRIAAIKNAKQIPAVMAWMQSRGIDVYFSLYVDADPMNSDANLVQTYQSGLGLGERDYYIDRDSNMVKIRGQYKQHIAKMFRLCGFSSSDSKSAVEAVMEIETAIAKVSYTKEKQRDPHANYHKMSISKLCSDYAGFDWNTYMKGFGLNVSEVSVSQPEPIKEVIRIINHFSLKKQKYYMDWCLINEAATSLGDKMFEQNFEFYGKVLSGTKEPQPRWKRAVSMVNGSMGEAVGQMYVEKYFPAAYKERMLNLVHNLQTALGERMQSLTWMGDSTKVKALDKLRSFHVKIGYPDKWRDYSALDVSGNTLWENRKNVAKFNTDFMMAKAAKPVDKDEWYMTPQTVNAYYNPTTNEVCFPAGILQYPFFDMQADDAFNYGAIGVVIGHEMTHGFDDQGRQFDKNGNMVDWWTVTDAENFTAKAKVLALHFDSIVVAPGIHANGEFTLGENLADHGGLQIAYQAFKSATQSSPLPVKNGFTPEQRFFLAFAGVWADNIRPEEILRRTKTDPHALGKWRVNGALPEINAWYDAFSIKPSDSLYVEPSKRVSIW